MLKTKYALSALGLLVAMTMATDALAQGIFTVSSSIESRARMNSHTEASGGITLSQTTGTADEGGTITITYGATITNDIGDMVSEDEIVVYICDDNTVATSTEASADDNAITITVPANACTGTENIDVSGVLLGIADSGLTEVTASISATGDIRLGSGANQVTVISNTVDELTDGGVSVGQKLTVVRHTGEAVPTHKADEDGENRFHLLIAENAVDSFDDAQLILDFDGLPAGATVTLDAWVTASSNIGRGKPGPTVATIATHGPPIPVQWTWSKPNSSTSPNVRSDQIGFFDGRNTDGTLKAPTPYPELDAEDDTASVLFFLHPEMDDDDATAGVNEIGTNGC